MSYGTGKIGAAAAHAFDPPMCGRCGKPVERIETWEDPMACRLMVTVYCHGQHETAGLDYEVIEGRKFSGFGVAFIGPPALEAASPAAAAPPARRTDRSLTTASPPDRPRRR